MTHLVAANSVEVLQKEDAWIVRVTVNGHSEDNRFNLEKSARSFAEGQRLRLSMLAAQNERGAKDPLANS